MESVADDENDSQNITVTGETNNVEIEPKINVGEHPIVHQTDALDTDKSVNELFNQLVDEIEINKEKSSSNDNNNAGTVLYLQPKETEKIGKLKDWLANGSITGTSVKKAEQSVFSATANPKTQNLEESTPGEILLGATSSQSENVPDRNDSRPPKHNKSEGKFSRFSSGDTKTQSQTSISSTRCLNLSLHLEVSIVEFHVTQGPIIDCSYPGHVYKEQGTSNLNRLGEKIPFLALPARADENDSEYCYFTISRTESEPSKHNEVGRNMKSDFGEMLVGVSCFRQIWSKQASRNKLQRALAVLSCVPNFNILREIMETAVDDIIWLQKPDDRKAALILLHERLSRINILKISLPLGPRLRGLQSPNVAIERLRGNLRSFVSESSLGKSILRLGGARVIMLIIKCLILGKTGIIILGPSGSVVSEITLSIVSILPLFGGLLGSGFFHNNILENANESGNFEASKLNGYCKDLMDALKQSMNVMAGNRGGMFLPCCGLDQLGEIERVIEYRGDNSLGKGLFFVGTTNPALGLSLKRNGKCDILITLEEPEQMQRSRSPSPATFTAGMSGDKALERKPTNSGQSIADHQLMQTQPTASDASLTGGFWQTSLKKLGFNQSSNKDAPLTNGVIQGASIATGGQTALGGGTSSGVGGSFFQGFEGAYGFISDKGGEVIGKLQQQKRMLRKQYDFSRRGKEQMEVLTPLARALQAEKLSNREKEIEKRINDIILSCQEDAITREKGAEMSSSANDFSDDIYGFDDDILIRTLFAEWLHDLKESMMSCDLDTLKANTHQQEINESRRQHLITTTATISTENGKLDPQPDTTIEVVSLETEPLPSLSSIVQVAEPIFLFDSFASEWRKLVDNKSNTIFKDKVYTLDFKNGEQYCGGLSFGHLRDYVKYIGLGILPSKGIMRDGYGKYYVQTTDNKSLFWQYEGYWKDDLFHGHGTLSWGTFENAYEHIYDGDWFEGQRSGRGSCTVIGKATYVGNWFGDMFHGEGELVNAKGNIYKGEWDTGERHGLGKWESFETGETYKGNFMNNKRSGFGTSVYKDSSVYSGMWKNDRRSGEGTWIHAATGRSYSGLWENGLRHGRGKHCTEDGAELIGEWVNDYAKIIEENEIGVKGKETKWLITESDWDIAVKSESIIGSRETIGMDIGKLENSVAENSNKSVIERWIEEHGLEFLSITDGDGVDTIDDSWSLSDFIIEYGPQPSYTFSKLAE